MYTHPTPRLSPTALGLVALAHVGVFMAMAAMREVTPPAPLPAVMVALIAPTPAPLKAAEPTPVKPAAKPAPRPERPRASPGSARPVLTTQADAAPEAPLAPKVPAQVPTPVTSAEPAKTTPTPAAPSPKAEPAPPAPTAPRFDADYLDNPRPSYPAISRREGEQGKVVLKVFVLASGLPGSVEVRTSSGFERLDKAAVSAVSRWKFDPARQGHETVSAWVTVPIAFSLKD